MPTQFNSTAQRPELEPIAIIGIGCRYPGGIDSPETFWELLKNEIDAIGEIPADRFDPNYYYALGRQPGKIISREGGFLSAIDQFDPAVFGISPREALYIDPQQRLLLQVAWEALECGGQVPRKLAGSRTGIFIGMWATEYRDRMFHTLEDVNLHHLIGGYLYGAPGRLSYVFDFRGPSVVVDTACSSSLVAAHLACTSIWNGESELALTGGVNVILEPDISIATSRSSMLSPDGRCRFGDAKASGYVRSEGAGIVVLEPLSRALANHDPIFALIRGSASNNDGRNGGVISAPGFDTQVAVMRAAYARAGIQPSQVGYVEAHGTGTPTGDPIEVKALAHVLGENRPSDSPIILGSVKSNIGHTEPAAGVAGLIKAALVLNHHAIPASIHFEEPNPAIPWTELPVKVQQALGPFPQTVGPAFAAVNSFGVTGTNAHIVLQEALPAPDTEGDFPAGEEVYLIPFSAHTPEALKEMLTRQVKVMISEPEQAFSLHDLAYTRATRRSHQPYRAAFGVGSRAELIESLEAFLRNELTEGASTDYQNPEAKRQPVFVFSGMGPQWWGMGRELLAKEPVFRQAVEEVDALFHPLAGWSLLHEFAASEAESRMDRADVAQPANFALQIGLVALWRSWGIVPAAIVGHSTGEIAVAYVSGILSLPDAVKVAYHRSRLQQLTAGEGKMLAVGLSQAEAEQRLAGCQDRVSIAAINSTRSITLSGNAQVLDELESQLKSAGLFARFLHSEVPYHSPQMDRLRMELLDVLRGLECHPAVIPTYTTVTGQLAESDAYSKEYWWRNVRQPVYFAQALAQMIADGYHDFLEISPHPVLATALTECLQHANQQGIILPSLRRMKPERQELLNSLGMLYTAGAQVEWSGLYPNGQCIALPLYPWQPQRFWFEEDGAQPALDRRWRLGQHTILQTHPFLNQHIQSAVHSGTHLWQTDLDLAQFPYLKDHRIRDLIVFPGAALVEIMLAAATEAMRTNQFVLEEIKFKEALFLSEAAPRILQVVISPQASDQLLCQIFTRPAQGEEHQAAWTLHSTGIIHSLSRTEPLEQLSPAQAQGQAKTVTSGSEHHQKMNRHMLFYGPSFRAVQSIWQLPDHQALGQLCLNETTNAEASTYHIHPALFDAAIQVLFATADDSIAPNEVYLPVSLERLCFYRSVKPEAIWCRAQLRQTQVDAFVGDICLLDSEGHVILEAQGLCCQKVKRSLQQLLNDWLYEIVWKPQPRAQQPEQPKLVEAGRWLILADSNGVGEALAQQLNARSAESVLVEPGSAYARLQQDRYRINPAEPLDFQRLLQERFGGQYLPCQGIVHLWSLEKTHSAEMDLSSLWNSQLLNSGSVLHLVQALLQSGWAKLPDLWLVTQEAQAVGPQLTPVHAEHASVWGLAQVISLEYPQFKCKCLDYDGLAADSSQAFVEELLSPTAENRIAWRQGVRYVARLQRRLVQVREATQLQENGSYLITGGLGALGLQVAEWLAQQGARHLLLTGRSGIINTFQQDAVKRLEESGVQVEVVKADIAQEEEVRRLLIKVQERGMPPLRGIIHAAGVLDDGILQNQNWERFTHVLAPKVAGAWNLHRLTFDQPLDLFVCFSSIIGMLGWPGEGNYAAANAFLDALAQHRRALGLPGLSLNWGPWAQAGMAARLETREQARLSEQGINGFLPEDGLRVLEALLCQPNICQLAVLSINWTKFLAEPSNSFHLPFLEAFAPTADVAPVSTAYGGFLRELQAAPVGERQDMLTAHVRSQLARVLRLIHPKQIGLHQRLFELGVDSLLAIELRNRLESSLAHSLRATLLFDYPTLELLVNHLAHDVLEIDFSDDVQAELPVSEPEANALDSLSEDEIAELLAQKLTAIRQGVAE